MGDARVLLLVGPAGSGKTSLGERIAANPGWVHVSDDNLWNALEAREVEFVTRVLRPSVEALLERQDRRGRSSERDIEVQRFRAEQQLACLHSDRINGAWVIDSSDETLEETYDRHFRDLVGGRDRLDR